MPDRNSSARFPAAPRVASGWASTSRDNSSSGERPAYRPKRLAIHEGSLTNCAARNRASTPESSTFTPRERDSANMRAALELRRLRENAGLTQEQAAELVGADPKTVRQRENGVVDLGALKQRQRLVEAARQRILEAEAKENKP